MNYLSIIALLLFSLVNAQHQRFTYEYKFAPDGNNLDSLNTELMALDVTENGSEFYSLDKKISDSLMKAELEKQFKKGGNITMPKSVKGGLVKQTVSKNYSTGKVQLTDKFGSHTYLVEDNRPLNWKISNETEKIGEWNCQKATVDFAGRSWEVWFSSDLPINDGPYKFKGLPGLIVKATSKDQSHQYKLVGIKKLSKVDNESNKNSNNSIRFAFNKKPIKLSQKKYAKQKAKYLKDPTAEMRQLLNSGSTISVSFNGKKLSNNELLRNIEKENKNKKRNPIELNFSE